jgi:hypothetical protein
VIGKAGGFACLAGVDCYFAVMGTLLGAGTPAVSSRHFAGYGASCCYYRGALSRSRLKIGSCVQSELVSRQGPAIASGPNKILIGTPSGRKRSASDVARYERST